MWAGFKESQIFGEKFQNKELEHEKTQTEKEEEEVKK